MYLQPGTICLRYVPYTGKLGGECGSAFCNNCNIYNIGTKLLNLTIDTIYGHTVLTIRLDSHNY